MIVKFTLFGLILLLIVVIAASYYTNKEGFDDISNGYLSKISNDLSSAVNTVSTDVSSSSPRVVVDTQIDDVFLNINANTTDGSTIYGAKILYNSNIPVLSSGQTTDSTLAIDLVIPPTSFTVTNKPLSFFQNGFKYYIVSNNVSKYTEGTTPLLGSFIFNNSGATTTSTPSVMPPAADSSMPVRNDVVPQVSISGSGYDAMTLQQKADMLKDIQKVVRNEVLASRSTTPILNGNGNGNGSCKGNGSDSTAQGQEYSDNCCKDTEYRCPKNPDGSCPPVPDMSQYIKKDQIPC
jgi:hypothetical protein